MTKHNRFPSEVRQRAVAIVLVNQNIYNSKWAAICAIAPKIGCTPDALRIWLSQQEPEDDGQDMAGIARYDNPYSSMPLDVATAKKSSPLYGNSQSFPERKHGQAKV